MVAKEEYETLDFTREKEWEWREGEREREQTNRMNGRLIALTSINNDWWRSPTRWTDVIRKATGRHIRECVHAAKSRQTGYRTTTKRTSRNVIPRPRWYDSWRGRRRWWSTLSLVGLLLPLLLPSLPLSLFHSHFYSFIHQNSKIFSSSSSCDLIMRSIFLQSEFHRRTVTS
jgi:hypothetical protein